MAESMFGGLFERLDSVFQSGKNEISEKNDVQEEEVVTNASDSLRISTSSYVSSLGRKLSSLLFEAPVETKDALTDTLSPLTPYDDGAKHTVFKYAYDISLPSETDVIHTIPNNYMPPSSCEEEEEKEKEEDIWNPKTVADQKNDFRWKYYVNRYKEGSPELPEDPEFPQTAMNAALKWNDPNPKKGNFYTNICYPRSRQPKLCVGRYTRLNPHNLSFAELLHQKYGDSDTSNIDPAILAQDAIQAYAQNFNNSILQGCCGAGMEGVKESKDIPFVPCMEGWVSRTERAAVQEEMRRRLQTQFETGTGQTFGRDNLRSVLDKKETKNVLNDYWTNDPTQKFKPKPTHF